MTPLRTIESIAVPILIDNVDTDTIIPSREMKTTGRTGLAEGMFAPWRYSDAIARIPDPEFALNKPEAASAQVLLGGTNFGCGSSREHAVWALAEYGIRCVIAPTFAPIFRNNCIRNGILPIVLDRDLIEKMAWQELHINLPAQKLRCGDAAHAFEIDGEEKEMLVEGLDVIDITLQHRGDIEQWLDRDRTARPHVYLEGER
ncbi:3-isopropylmalate dehydratase small subunit [Altererythrobacter sp. MF3-039]|uniref:3-isopropylmalate dehydratase small subunit n=1 Tax=Altererythrobacter sp. MF3-039 TaxID=3252901 RepID=UPI00390C4087